jgi:3-oxoacyl-[acyl-carrier protein] reductase
MEEFKNRVVWVTGSTRGIGAAVARAFAARGAKVAVHGRDADAAASVCAELSQMGAPAISVLGDLTEWPQVESLRERVEHELGPIDILIANAGGNFSPPGPLEETTEAGWRASMDGNLTTTFLTLKSVLPGMKQRRAGNIVTISSAAGRRPHPHSPIAYGVAKAGLCLLTQSVATQVGEFGIRANCIAPEAILTERNQQRIPDALQLTLAAAHPIRRLGTPEDVADAALFLASDAAAWITGVVLDVAGGAVMV